MVSDFTVEHVGTQVRLTDFYGCDVAPETVVNVRWEDWGRAMLKVGESVLRRLPAEKRGVTKRVLPSYRRYRRLLREDVLRLRRKLGEGAVRQREFIG